MRLIYTDFSYDFLEKISVNQSYQPNQYAHNAKVEIAERIKFQFVTNW